MGLMSDSPMQAETRFHAGGADELRDDALSLLESLHEGVIFLDQDWRIRYANAAAREISRIAEEHILGPTHWELYPATVGTEQERVYRRSMEERVSLTLEVYYAPFDIWVSLQTVPIPSGIAVYYRDITRLKKAEITRDDAARQLGEVLEQTTDAIVMLDREWKFRFLNRRAMGLLSSGNDLLGVKIWDAFPQSANPELPFWSNYHRAMDERVPVHFEAFYPEPLNAWFSNEAMPSDGGIIIYFRDVTTQREAEEKLRRKSEQAERQAAEIESVYRVAPIGLALFDLDDYHYLRLNNRQAEFFGMKPEDILGKTLLEMAPIEGLRELFDGVRDGTPVVNYPLEGTLVGRPGEHRYWTVNYSPVYAADGSVQAIAAASLEITQQKRAEMALIQSEKLAAVGRLASSISHEINNPLEAVTNLLYLISASEDLPKDVRYWTELAEREVARVSQIATQTLRFHRQTVKPTKVNAEQLIAPVLDLYLGRLSNSGVQVQTKFLSKTAVLCLENEIRQVLNNLIANAIDAMKSGGRLVISAHDARHHLSGVPGVRGIRITVADTGHGMPKETQQRIFEAFFTTKDLNGTGLGLWISKDIVERHGGALNVRSSSAPEKHGTIFSLFLPVDHVPEHGEPAQPN